MTNEELQLQIEDLRRMVTDLRIMLTNMQSVGTFPVSIQQALVGRGFIRTNGPKTGVVTAQGLAPATVLTGVSRNMWVASSSGGGTTNNVLVTNGVVTT